METYLAYAPAGFRLLSKGAASLWLDKKLWLPQEMDNALGCKKRRPYVFLLCITNPTLPALSFRRPSKRRRPSGKKQGRKGFWTMPTDGANASGLSCGRLKGLSESPDHQTGTLEVAGRLVGYATGGRYRLRGEFLFNDVPLAGTHVLEVGCGRGAWSIWAALHGASRVVGIEPDADGSTSGSLESLRRSIKILGLESQIEARSELLQNLPKPEVPYDVVVMYNVINHLDEEAVTILHRDSDARKRYVTLLQDLRSRMQKGGWLIVADCGRDNVWPSFGLRSPLAPTIEWHKHQNPHTWIDILRQAGFRDIDLRWSPLQPVPRLTANRFVQYLTCSHFVLRFQRS